MDVFDCGYLDGLLGAPVQGEDDAYLAGHMAGEWDRERFDE